MNPEKNPLVSRGQGDIENVSHKEGFHEEQRRVLGIPASLHDKSVLHLNVQRGVFDARYAEHVAEFFRPTQEEGNPTDKESVFVDLSECSSEQVVELLRQAVMKTDPGTEQEILPSQTGRSDPLPGYVATITYLPALDMNGKVIGGTDPHTFAIDRLNYQAMLPQLAKFLEEQSVLIRTSTQIEESGEEKES